MQLGMTPRALTASKTMVANPAKKTTAIGSYPATNGDETTVSGTVVKAKLSNVQLVQGADVEKGLSG